MRESLVAFTDRISAKVRSQGSYPLWWNILDEAGYPQVHVNDWNVIMNHDSPATQWCNEHVGWGDYYISGQAVFFTRDEDAVNFALRWA